MKTNDSSAVADSPRILIVDDEPTLRLSFGFALENEGYTVEMAADGDEALERLRDPDAPALDAMLLDLRMPGMSGLDVLRELKGSVVFVPAVIVSAYIDSPTAVEAVDLGVTEFLRKPVTPDQIRGVIAKLLEEEKAFEDPESNQLDPAARARWLLRRRDVGMACSVFEALPSPIDDSDAVFWRMLSEHLRACRAADGEFSQFASSRFYKAADLLTMLAFNR